MHHNYSRTISYQGTSQPTNFGVKGRYQSANYNHELGDEYGAEFINYETTTSKHIQRIGRKHETQPLVNPLSFNGLQEPEQRGYLECPYGATGQLPYALDCKQFLNCFKGRGAIQNCAGGSAFNPETRECDYPDKVKCTAYKSQADIFQQKQAANIFQSMFSNREMLGRLHAAASEMAKKVECPRGARGLLPNPNDCKSYLLCEHGRTKIEQCASGTLFNPVISSCDYPANVNCDARIPVEIAPSAYNSNSERSEALDDSYRVGKTANVKNTRYETSYRYQSTQGYQSPKCPQDFAGLLPHPTECAKFLNCAGGRTYIQDCGPGTVFNPQISTCDYPYNVDCAATSQTTQTDHGNSEYISGQVSNLECPNGFTGFYPHPAKCSLYLNCNNGQGEVLQCETGKYYNHVTQKCDWVSNVDCREFSMGGSVVGTNCPEPNGLFDLEDETQFLNCSNGVGVIEYCPTGTTFCPTLLECLRDAKSIEKVFCPKGRKGLMPHPTQCHLYLNCENGRVQTCATGTAFNRKTSQCDWIKNVNCLDWYTGHGVRCPPGKTGLVPHPTKCDLFLNCLNGETNILNCKRGTVFNPKTLECDFPQNVNCNDQEHTGTVINTSITGTQEIRYFPPTSQLERVRCQAGQSGYQPHPYCCQSYLSCENGKTFILHCGPGELFDSISLRCNQRNQVTCSNSVPEAQIVAEQLGKFECPPGIYGLTRHPTDCTLFLNCGTGKIQKCPSGSKFNPDNLVCDDRYVCKDTGIPVFENSYFELKEVKCPSGFFGTKPHPYNCNQYLRCGTGKTVIQDCEPGNSFNPKTSRCEASHLVECAGVDSKEIQCPPGFIGILDHPNNCNQYLKCGNGKTLIMSCKPGKYFNPTMLFCDHPDNVFCNKPRSQVEYIKSPHQGLAPHPTSADLYIDSSNGFMKVENCIPGLMFNPTTLKCEENQQPGAKILLANKKCPPGFKGVLPHPYNCNQYIRCPGNGQTIPESCKSGEHFNPTMLLCENYDNAYCAKPTSTERSTQTSIESAAQVQYLECPKGFTGLSPHPTVNFLYMNCVDGYLKIGDCGAGMEFNSKDLNCKPINELTNAVVCPAGYVGVIAHPKNCNQYIKCQPGLTTIENCSPGKRFNPDLLFCDRPDKVQCATPPPKSTQIQYLKCLKIGIIPHPTSCNWYLTCSEGNIIVQECKNGLMFNPRTLKCERSNHCGNMYQPTQDNKCPIGFTGYLEHPLYCNQYLKCQSGQTEIGSCMPSQRYNPILQFCDHFDNVFCTKTDLQLPAARNPLIKCFGSSSGLTSHPTKKDLYIDCEPGFIMVKNCPPGTLFDSSTLVCQPPSPSEPSLCPKYSYGLHPHPNNCKLYVSCDFGHATIKVCGDGQNFNPDTLRCDSETRCNAQMTCSEEFIPHPTFCDSYFQCKNGLNKLKQCELGKVFNARISRCDFPRNVDCGNLIISPPKCSQGFTGIVIHPKYCNLYLQCTNGETEIQECPFGKLFDSRQSVCDWVSNVDCENRPVRHTEVVTTPQTNQVIGQSIDWSHWNEFSESQLGIESVKCSPGYSGVQPHPNMCNLFLQCSNGLTFVKLCPRGMNFNPRTSNCDSSQSCQGLSRIEIETTNTIEIRGMRNESSNRWSSWDQSLGSQLGLDTVQCQVGQKGFITHPNICNLFLECINGQTFIKICTQGSVFNPKKLSCDWPENVDCQSRRIVQIQMFGNGLFNQGTIHQTGGQSQTWSQGNTQTTGVTQRPIQTGSNQEPKCPEGFNGLMAHPRFCDSFVQCGIGESFVRRCVQGLLFNPTILNCDWPQNVDCGTRRTNKDISQGQNQGGIQTGGTQIHTENTQSWSNQGQMSTSEAKCPERFTGFKRHPQYCNSYLHCSNGETTIQNCGKDSVFNPRTQKCDSPVNVDCGTLGILYLTNQGANHGGIQTGGTHIHTEHSQSWSSQGQVSTSDTKCPLGYNGFKRHPQYCNSYLHCSNGETIIKNCDEGLVFNPTNQKCDYPIYVDCGTLGILYQTNQGQNQGHIQGGSLITEEQSQTGSWSIGSGIVNKCPKGYNGLMPHPELCNAFIQCAQGQSFIKHCQQGRVYNPKILNCDSAANVQCGNLRISQVGDHASIDSSGVNTHGEHGSWITGNQNGLEMMSCPFGFTGLKPHPQICDVYLECNNGQPNLKQCYHGEGFDRNRLICEKNPDCEGRRMFVGVLNNGQSIHTGSHVHEEQSQSSSWTNQGLTEAIISAKCPQSYTGLKPHPQFCNMYLQCSNGKTYIKQCDKGLGFSPIIENCDWLDKVNCGSRQLVTMTQSTLTLEGAAQSTQIGGQTQGGSGYEEHWSSSSQFQQANCPQGHTGLLPHPQFCNAFVQCSNGIKSFQICGEGTVFNPSTSVCDWPKNVNCGSLIIGNLESMNRQAGSNGLEGYEETQEIEISGNAGMVVNFGGLTGSQILECTQGQNGLKPHPTLCDSYLECTNGRAIIRKCAQGMSFNHQSLTCDSSSAKCGIRGGYSSWSSSSSWSSQSPIISTQTGTNLKLVQCPSGITGLQPHPKLCNLYLECSNGNTIIKQCEPGKVFNIDSENCEPHKQVRCGSRGIGSYQSISSFKPICPNKKPGLYPHPQTCSKYLDCTTGVAIERDCKFGESFDLEKLICLPKSKQIPQWIAPNQENWDQSFDDQNTNQMESDVNSWSQQSQFESLGNDGGSSGTIEQSVLIPSRGGNNGVKGGVKGGVNLNVPAE